MHHAALKHDQFGMNGSRPDQTSHNTMRTCTSQHVAVNSKHPERLTKWGTSELKSSITLQFTVQNHPHYTSCCNTWDREMKTNRSVTLYRIISISTPSLYSSLYRITLILHPVVNTWDREMTLYRIISITKFTHPSGVLSLFSAITQSHRRQFSTIKLEVLTSALLQIHIFWEKFVKEAPMQDHWGNIQA